MKSKTAIIIAREYTERVKKKSFIITTLLMPLMMIALGAAPTLIMAFSEPEKSVFNVVDQSGVVAQGLKNSDELTFHVLDVDPEVALTDKTVNGLIVIPADIIKRGSEVKIYTDDAIGMSTEQTITSMLDKTVENERLKEYNIENLDKILDKVKANIHLQNIRLDKNEDEQNASSATISMILGYLLTFILYMALLLYGQMVMTSIIEEKGNRVLELVVTSVKPVQLMYGKIAGIGLVALTQMAIWLVLVVAISGLLLPLLIPAEVMSMVSSPAVGGGADIDPELLQMLGVLTDPGYLAGLFGYLIIFLIGGFLLYAAVYAAIGSAVDNIQDASQLQTFIMLPIILGIVFGMTAATAPNSTLSVVTSLIPFTSPMVMPARIPFGIPTWEILLSIALLIVGVIAMVWLAAKIYRVGIFMYGKKPTFKELILSAKYK